MINYVEKTTENKNVPSFICEVCLQSFASKQAVSKHIERRNHFVHNKNGTFLEVNYSCQHFRSTKISKRRTKGTECKSKIYASLKIGPAYGGCSLIITFNHNHLLDSANILCYRKPTSEVSAYFQELFNIGMKPANALRCYKNHIRTKMSDEEYAVKSVDRSVVPDFDWVKYYFGKLLKTKYKMHESTTVHELQEFIKKQDDKTTALLEDPAENIKTTSSDVAIEELSVLKMNLYDLICFLEENPKYYYSALCYMNNELLKLRGCTQAARLKALFSFNKNANPRFKKNIVQLN